MKAAPAQLAALHSKPIEKLSPLLVYFQGGGWIMAGIDGHDASARRLTNRANTMVVSVGCRQAPEHPCPAAHDDCHAATRWVIKNAKPQGGHPGEWPEAGPRTLARDRSYRSTLPRTLSIRARSKTD